MIVVVMFVCSVGADAADGMGRIYVCACVSVCVSVCVCVCVSYIHIYIQNTVPFPFFGLHFVALHPNLNPKP